MRRSQQVAGALRLSAAQPMRAIRTPGGEESVCEDMVVEDCTLDSACQCIRLGCPSDGTIRNGAFRNLKMRGFNGVISVHPVRYLLDDEHGSCRMANICAISFSVEPGITLRNFGDVTFRNIRLKSAKALTLNGTGDTPLRNMRFENVTGAVGDEKPVDMSNVEGIGFERFAGLERFRWMGERPLMHIGHKNGERQK